MAAGILLTLLGFYIAVLWAGSRTSTILAIVAVLLVPAGIYCFIRGFRTLRTGGDNKVYIRNRDNSVNKCISQLS